MIGLFGLLGVGGRRVGALAGRVADAAASTRATGGLLAVVLAGWGLLALGPHSLLALMAGIVLFDLGVQGHQILNQSVIFRRVPRPAAG